MISDALISNIKMPDACLKKNGINKEREMWWPWPCGRMITYPEI